jgi:hypothetical protein
VPEPSAEGERPLPFQGLYRALVASVWSGGSVRHTGAFWFPIPVSDFWQLIEDFERYQERWPWLETFTADQDGLVAGNVLRATILPPVPLRIRIQVRFHSCQRLASTEASITGDLCGHASLSFDEHGGGTRVRADWTLAAASAPVRVLMRVARPLVAWGHDRVVDLAVTGLGGTTSV